MSTNGDQFEFPDQPKARIMLLGTFHFQDAGLDHYKPQRSFDTMSKRRQQEIMEVIELLEAFQPTKIAVECMLRNQDDLDQYYNAYLRDEFQLPCAEIYQLGFRLARNLSHSKLYCVDALGSRYESSVNLDEYAREHDQEHLLSQWFPRFAEHLKAADELVDQLTLREMFLNGNSEGSVLNGHGIYLVDFFKIGVGDEYPGVDEVTAWYSRNLKIFANLQRITDTPDEKILLIIGSGHLPILRHCVITSPEYNLVEICDYLR